MTMGTVPPPEAPDDLIPISVALAEFRISRSTLYSLVSTGRLTAHRRRVGRPRVFIDRRELRAMLEVRRSPASRRK